LLFSFFCYHLRDTMGEKKRKAIDIIYDYALLPSNWSRKSRNSYKLISKRENRNLTIDTDFFLIFIYT
jgi:hypothetical protein